MEKWISKCSEIEKEKVLRKGIPAEMRDQVGNEKDEKAETNCEATSGIFLRNRTSKYHDWKSNLKSTIEQVSKEHKKQENEIKWAQNRENENIEIERVLSGV